MIMIPRGCLWAEDLPSGAFVEPEPIHYEGKLVHFSLVAQLREFVRELGGTPQVDSFQINSKIERNKLIFANARNLLKQWSNVQVPYLKKPRDSCQFWRR